MFQITTKNDAPKAWFEIFLRSDTRTCPQRLVINLMQKIFPKIPNNNINNKNRNNNNHLWILEMGWLLKFISFRSISFQLGGRLRRPLNWNEHLLRTCDFASFSLVSPLFPTEYDYSTSTNQHICPPTRIRLHSSIASAYFPQFSNSSSSASFWATEMLFRWKLVRFQPGILWCARNWPSMPGSETAPDSFYFIRITLQVKFQILLGFVANRKLIWAWHSSAPACFFYYFGYNFQIHGRKKKPWNQRSENAPN